MTISICYVRALVEGLEQKGVDRTRFLESAGFDAGRLEAIDGRVDHEEYDALIGRALDVDPTFGLYMGTAVTEASYGLAAQMVSRAPTLRAAFDGLKTFHRLLNDRPEYELTEQGDTAALAFLLAPGALRCRRFHAEFTLACLYRMVQFFGRGAKPQRVEFEHPAPEYAAEYDRVFEGTQVFEQSATRVVFAREVVDKPQWHRDDEVHSVLKLQASRRVRRLTDGVTYGDRVFEYLLERATPDARGMEAAARAVGTSVRSLRRRLTEEGVSYNDILERALAARAKRFLCDEGWSIQDTAYTLGFSEPSAFHRAFKRWTGKTPKQFRQQHAS